MLSMICFLQEEEAIELNVENMIISYMGLSHMRGAEEIVGNVDALTPKWGWVGKDNLGQREK